MSWASHAAANLLPLSRQQYDLRAALTEWRYTGNFHDLERDPLNVNRRIPLEGGL